MKTLLHGLLVLAGGAIFLSYAADRASVCDQCSAAQEITAGGWAEIRVVDAETGRGVPLAELTTVNGLKFVTDNAGRVAFHEPGLLGRELFFTVRSHGYDVKPDGFGITGARVTPRAGQVSRIEITRKNIAERLCRLTGEGTWRDSVLLGHETPQPDPFARGRVAGQDSVQACIYGENVYWFWGDTLRMEYPLGLFRMAGATTSLSATVNPKFDPAGGIPFRYFVDQKSGFVRAMMPLSERPKGVVWVGAVFTVPDERGTVKLVGHYSRRKGLTDELEQGIAVFNDEKAIFEPALQLPLTETWRRPSGHPIQYRDGETRWILCGSPNPNVRVPATLKDVLDPSQYEAFTCAAAVSGAAPSEPKNGTDGQPLWRWQKQLPPVDSKQEFEWIERGKLEPQQARFCPADAAAPADRVILHSGTVRWNEHRKKWVLLAGQVFGKPSMLGEVWYAEANHPTGPFPTAVRVVTHDRQTFYNVCHHPFLDRDGGRFIHFEGTYTNEFSGNAQKTPRYNYNQILYRLDLESAALRAALADDSTSPTAALEWIRPSDDGTHFIESDSGKRFVVWGVNYDHDASGRLLDEYWIDEWPTVAKDFREIKALGANCVRIHLQVGKLMDSPDKPNVAAIEQLKQIVKLAEETRLYLDVTGLACYHKQNIPAWYDALGEQQRWAVQAVFWESVAKACGNSPAIFCYDLMNEPILPGKEPAAEWLAGELGGKHFVQRLTLDLKGRSREQVAQAWTEKMVAAIRKHDRRQMITVGVIPWVFVFGGGKPLFYSPRVGKQLDFVAVHFYPKKGEVDKALRALKAYDVGKPLLVEEMFPLACSEDELAEFVEKSSGYADGWISFYWGTPADVLRAKDDRTIGEAITASWLGKFRRMSKRIAGRGVNGR